MPKKTTNHALSENKANLESSVPTPSGSAESWIIQPHPQTNVYTNFKHLNNGSTALT